MVSYYNTLPYAQKHSAANLAYGTGQPWQWTANYHTPPNHQFITEMESSHAHHTQMFYNPHHMFHTAAGTPSEWHSPTSTADNFPQNPSAAHQMLQQHHTPNGAATAGGGGSSSSASSGSSSTASGPASGGNTQLNESGSSLNEHIADGLPSPPITVSGSEISSPGAPTSSSSPHHVAHLNNNNNNNNSPSTVNQNNNTTAAPNSNSNRTPPAKTQYYDWMKKPSYSTQPTPGKTRTKDKYRVVYTDYQRLELEKEYCTSRYITIRRKTELAQTLSLSERQVKIWFQNRRAKERKQNKKGSDPTAVGGIVQHGDYANLMDTKPKLEPGLHLQHSLHSMSSMAMGMPSMGLHLSHHHHPLAVSAAHSHQLHQPSHAQMTAAAAGVSSLSM